jgi:hypothetical protein
MRSLSRRNAIDIPLSRDLHERKCVCDECVTKRKSLVMSSTEKVFDGKL